MLADAVFGTSTRLMPSKLKSHSTKYVGGSAGTRWARSSERAYHQGNVRSQSQDRTRGAKCYQGPKIAHQEQPDPKDPPEGKQARDPANALHNRRRLACLWRGGDFYPANLTEIIVHIQPPPVASSPFDRGRHTALTPHPFWDLDQSRSANDQLRQSKTDQPE